MVHSTMGTSLIAAEREGETHGLSLDQVYDHLRWVHEVVPGGQAGGIDLEHVPAGLEAEGG